LSGTGTGVMVVGVKSVAVMVSIAMRGYVEVSPV
jgi:hypothetical protein